MSPDVTDLQEEQARHRLDVLNAEAAAVRAELGQLRQKLMDVEHELHAAPADVLRDANEQLVLAAVRAQEIADTARDTLERAASPAATKAVLEQLAVSGQLGDLREANERLVLAALHSHELEQEASEAHRRQVAFLATVTHELRNPLLPLRLAVRMLDHAGGDSAMLAQLQATITGQVSHIARLIGDLLDGVRVSTGKFRIERTHVDLLPILERAIQTLLPGMQGRHQSFTSALPTGPLMVFGDPVRLRQIFGNLLENASKYTPEGGEVRLAATVQDQMVVVTITDNGIGISPAALPHLFKMFVQDARAVEFDGGGLGIGLAVVQELVLAHGGQVAATSAGAGQGSQFRVTLPLEVPPVVG